MRSATSVLGIVVRAVINAASRLEGEISPDSVKIRQICHFLAKLGQIMTDLSKWSIRPQIWSNLAFFGPPGPKFPRITLSPPGSESTLRFPRSPRDTPRSGSRSSHPISFHFIYPIRIIPIVRHGASSSSRLNRNSVIRKYLWHIGVIESSRPESNYFSVITGS
jgi:hypothetical protein